MTKINIKLITNSAISYLSAFLVATILHECGHALTAKLLNINCILYHNYVKFSTLNVPVPKIVIILASGPLTSLISGIIFKFFFNKRKIRDQFQLFLLWSYLIGLTNFFGYVMIGAFTNSGDIG